MQIFLIFSAVILSVLFTVFIRSKSQEYAYLLSLCAVAVTLIYILISFFPYLSSVNEILEENNINSASFKICLKAVGIGYITEFISSTAEDYGLSSLSLIAELGGKCAIFLLALPLIKNILDIALGLI